MKTSTNFPAHPENSRQTPLAGGHPNRAFTLIELVVVMGTLAVLALLLVPALAGTKMDVLRLQCQANLKQLQVGMRLFTQDHNDMFPPAAYATRSWQVSWDSWIYNYISGGKNVTVSQAAQGLYVVNSNDASVFGIGVGLPIVACPVDITLPKISWMHYNSDPIQPLEFAPRTYAMNSAGTAWATTIQVNPMNGSYPLPDLNQPNCRGVGIYWQDSTSGYPDWDAKSYKTSVVKDPAGTILLCENPSNEDPEGSQWPSVCCGPVVTIANWSSLFQTDLSAPTDAATLHNSSMSYSEGLLLYPAHGNRFNYLFHDGHVAALSIGQTIGTGTLTAPKGMWTVVPGD